MSKQGSKGGLDTEFLSHLHWFMNMPVALESRSADMEMDASEVREVSLTWMLREQGEFLDRM